MFREFRMQIYLTQVRYVMIFFPLFEVKFGANALLRVCMINSSKAQTH